MFLPRLRRAAALLMTLAERSSFSVEIPAILLTLNVRVIDIE